MGNLKFLVTLNKYICSGNCFCCILFKLCLFISGKKIRWRLRKDIFNNNKNRLQGLRVGSVSGFFFRFDSGQSKTVTLTLGPHDWVVEQGAEQRPREPGQRDRDGRHAARVLGKGHNFVTLP